MSATFVMTIIFIHYPGGARLPTRAWAMSKSRYFKIKMTRPFDNKLINVLNSIRSEVRAGMYTLRYLKYCIRFRVF